MNLESLRIERFVMSLEDSDTFIENEIGLLSDEDYYDGLRVKYPDIFVPKVILNLDIAEKLSTKVVPLCYSENGTIILGTLIDFIADEKLKIITYEAEYDLVQISLKDFINVSERYINKIRPVVNYSAKTLWAIIVSESKRLKSIEVTLESKKDYCQVHNNIMLNKVVSKIKVPKELEIDMYNLLTSSSRAYNPSKVREPIKTSIEIDYKTRARVSIYPSYFGFTITCRLINKEDIALRLEDLNYLDGVAENLRSYFKNRKPGLKLIVGPTLSGKNTLAMSLLDEYLTETNLKCIAIEKPTEGLNAKIIQVNTESEEEYTKSVQALIGHNPDVIFITEINDSTAKEAMKIANFGKPLWSTLHANDTVSALIRLRDLTGESIRDILQVVDTIVYQRLVFKDGKLYPVVQYVNFDNFSRNRINKLTDEELLPYVRLKSTKLNDYVNDLIDKGIIDKREDFI